MRRKTIFNLLIVGFVFSMLSLGAAIFFTVNDDTQIIKRLSETLAPTPAPTPDPEFVREQEKLKNEKIALENKLKSAVRLVQADWIPGKNGEFTIEGKVENTFDKPLAGFLITFYFADSSGKIIAEMEKAFVKQSPMALGDIEEFSFKGVHPHLSPGKILVTAQYIRDQDVVLPQRPAEDYGRFIPVDYCGGKINSYALSFYSEKDEIIFELRGKTIKRIPVKPLEEAKKEIISQLRNLSSLKLSKGANSILDTNIYYQDCVSIGSLSGEKYGWEPEIFEVLARRYVYGRFHQRLIQRPDTVKYDKHNGSFKTKRNKHKRNLKFLSEEILLTEDNHKTINVADPIGKVGQIESSDEKNLEKKKIKRTFKASLVDVSGQIKPEVVSRVVNSRLGGVRYCYEASVKKHPDIGSGEVSIKFNISPSGTVDSCSVTRNTIKSITVQNCVCRMVRRWKFPQTNGGIVLVRYTFKYD